MTSEIIQTNEPTAIQVQQRQGPPTYADMMMKAIEQGMDAGSIEKLSMLMERQAAKQAEMAFSAAIAAFKQDCPVIVKNRAGYKDMYRYAELAEIQKIIDPILFRHGLRYRFDHDFNEKKITVICVVSHIQGHSETTKVNMVAEGTNAMNANQQAASAIMYGKRYSLTGALGITAEDDDDGRKSGPAVEPDDADEPLTPEQLKQIDDLLTITASDRTAFLLNVVGGENPPTAITGIVRRDFAKCLAALNNKKAIQDRKKGAAK